MTDSTEQARRELIADAPTLIHNEVAAGRPVWTTAEMQAEFRVTAFAAPFVVVNRRSDNVLGTLMFTGSPRFYFSFVPD